MKPCLICHAQVADNEPACPGCGEGSFGASAAEPARAPKPATSPKTPKARQQKPAED